MVRFISPKEYERYLEFEGNSTFLFLVVFYLFMNLMMGMVLFVLVIFFIYFFIYEFNNNQSYFQQCSLISVELIFIQKELSGFSRCV